MLSTSCPSGQSHVHRSGAPQQSVWHQNPLQHSFYVRYERFLTACYKSRKLPKRINHLCSNTNMPRKEQHTITQETAREAPDNHNERQQTNKAETCSTILNLHGLIYRKSWQRIWQRKSRHRANHYRLSGICIGYLSEAWS